MTYNQKLKKAIAYLGCDDYELIDEQWAIGLLKAIGITSDNPDGVEPPPVIAKSATEPPVIAPPVIYPNEEERAKLGGPSTGYYVSPPRKGW